MALGTLYKGGPRRGDRTCTRRCNLFGLAALADLTDAEVEYANRALLTATASDAQPGGAAALFQSGAENNPVAQNRLAHILASGQGAPADPVAATKWHLISKARGETRIIALDDFVSKLDPEKRARVKRRRRSGSMR